MSKMQSRPTAIDLRQQSDGGAMSLDKLGLIVWHDLFTPDENASRLFYQQVAGWSYITEHATDFSWGGGERDFVLAFRCDEAGAGFVGGNSGPISGWVPYFEARNVDSIADAAVRNGGSVLRAPFEVPGVGRNCLLCDPLGAHFGVSLSRHEFPVPDKQFEIERYLLEGKEFPIDFYGQLFDWDINDAGNIFTASPTTATAEAPIAICAVDTVSRDKASVWLPSIRVASLQEAVAVVEAGGGTVLNSPKKHLGGSAAMLINDPNGTLSYLVAEQSCSSR